MRLARDCGNVSSLFPPGVTRLYDLPYTIFNAIRLGLYFIGFEQYPEEERPPKKIWLDDDAMQAWWADVKASRESEAKGEGSTQGMTENKLMREMFGGRLPRG